MIGGRELDYYKLGDGQGFREVVFTYRILKVWGIIYEGIVGFVAFGFILITVTEFSPQYLISLIISIFIMVMIGLIFFTPEFRIRRTGDIITIYKRGSFLKRSVFTIGPESFPMMEGRDIRLTAKFFEGITRTDLRRYEPRVRYLEGKTMKHITLLPALYLLHRGGHLLMTKDDMVVISGFIGLDLLDSDEMGGSAIDEVAKLGGE